MQEAPKECGGFAMHFDERGALLVLAAFFRRALARLGNGDAAFFGDRANRFGKSGLVHFHHEFEDVTAGAAAEAVINLFHGVHGEGGSFLLMEGAETGEIGATLFQAHVFADDADDVRLLLYALRETSRLSHCKSWKIEK